MDLSAPYLRDALHSVDVAGWDSAAGRQLLDHVRRAVVVPVVRRSGLRGPAADQAEASGWEAAWDALRRPTARTAENPGGMVWVAVRRAVAAELEGGRFPVGAPAGAPPGPATDERRPARPTSPGGQGAPRLTLLAPLDQRARWLSLDDLMDGGWQPADTRCGVAEVAGSVVGAVLDGLVEVGWDRAEAADAIAIMADHATPARSGSPTTRWRWASLRLGVPEWRARRLAGLLLGGGGWPGVLELVALHGPSVLADPAVRGAVRSTTARWSSGPGAWLEGWGTPDVEQGIA